MESSVHSSGMEGETSSSASISQFYSTWPLLPGDSTRWPIERLAEQRERDPERIIPALWSDKKRMKAFNSSFASLI